jgi:hypothetical protein
MAMARLRRAWPWLLACLPATLLNPYGWGLYGAAFRQLSAPQLEFIGEWAPIPLNLETIALAVLPGDFRGEKVAILGIAFALAVVALMRKRLGAVVMLIVAATLAAHTIRLVAFLGIVTTIVGASVLDELPVRWPLRRVGATAAAVIAIVVICLRLSVDQEPLGGAGLSSTFPSKAIDFIERERIPGHIMTLTSGAYFTWRLFPRYLDYYGARTLPFGPQGLARVMELSSALPDASLAREADRLGIRAILAQVGQGSPFRLRDFSASLDWVPIYLDESAAVFLKGAHPTPKR